MEFILGLYLVGYFISFGIAVTYKKSDESLSFALFVSFMFGFISWIGVGLVLGGFDQKSSQQKNDPNDPSI